eukprot:Em0001g891a
MLPIDPNTGELCYLTTSTSTCSTIGLVALLQVTVSPETPPQGQKGSSPFRPHSKQLQHGLNDYTVTAAPPPRDEELFEQNCDLRRALARWQLEGFLAQWMPYN